MSTGDLEDVHAYWDANPANSFLSTEEDRRRYFEEVEERRYRHEWHIPIVARFEQFRDRDVLEIGCGMGIDGLQFARNGARYVGIDLTPRGITMAKERFDLFGQEGALAVADAEALDLSDESFDHVHCFGVLMHSPHPERIVREILRVLRPGGTVCAMVYNRSSINYYVEIMFLRRLFRHLLYPRFMPRVLAALTGLSREKLERHRELLLRRPRMSKQEWININTDGPECPLSGVYSAREAKDLFRDFVDVNTEVWFFDRQHWPFIGAVMPVSVERWLGRRWGWHRMIYVRKPG